MIIPFVRDHSRRQDEMSKPDVTCGRIFRRQDSMDGACCLAQDHTNGRPCCCRHPRSLAKGKHHSPRPKAAAVWRRAATERGADYPFTAPFISPRTKPRWLTIVTASTG